MKNLTKKIAAILLSVILCFGSVIFFASAESSQYGDYGTYVLLGDSVASGYNDIDEIDSEFVRIDHSYAAIVADTIGAELIPMACPGFRTIEMRYMLEDDYEADEYLFHNAHDEEVMEQRIPEFRKAISEADLITLGIGGNDFGTYLTWVIADIMEKEGICTPFVNAARKLLEEKQIESDVIDSVIDLADTMDALPEVIAVLPQALAFGLSNYFENWNYMIEDIYALNPDVEMLVIGMFDNAVKTKEDAEKNEKALIKFNIGQMIVDMANKPMIEGAEKYGYTFIDTTGTTCDTYHPNYEGHKYIADKILKALSEINSTEPSDNTEVETAEEGIFEKIFSFVKNLINMIKTSIQIF